MGKIYTPADDIKATIEGTIKRLSDMLNGADPRRPIKMTLIARHQGDKNVYAVFSEEDFQNLEKLKTCIDHYAKTKQGHVAIKFDPNATSH